MLLLVVLMMLIRATVMLLLLLVLVLLLLMLLVLVVALQQPPLSFVFCRVAVLLLPLPVRLTQFFPFTGRTISILILLLSESSTPCHHTDQTMLPIATASAAQSIM